MANFKLAMPYIFEHEGHGQFTLDPDDPGGATKWGQSLRYLVARADLDHDGLPDGDMDGDGDVDVADVRLLTQDRAQWLYETGFWTPNRLNEVVDQRVAAKIFDVAVNAGSAQAWRFAQRSCTDLGKPLKVDGRLGPLTLAAVNCVNPLSFLPTFCEHQRRFYNAIIAAKPALTKYRNGWARRAAWPHTIKELGWSP